MFASEQQILPRLARCFIVGCPLGVKSGRHGDERECPLRARSGRCASCRVGPLGGVNGCGLVKRETRSARPPLENAPVDRQARLCHDHNMDLEVARKALSKRSTFSPKRIAFFVVAGLCVVAGILLRSGQYFAQPEVEQNAPVVVAPSPPPVAASPAVEATEPAPEPPPPAQESATAPTENVEPTGEAVEAPEQAGEAVEHAEQPEPPDSGMILVSRQPVAVLASPSSSAPTMYGFPAGRPFRVIGHDGGFAHIQDLKSSASGWINEAALAPPPRAPAASIPSQTKPFAVSRNPTNPSAGLKPKTTENDSTGTADSEAATQPDRRRPGLFGRGGLFGGIFGNGN